MARARPRRGRGRARAKGTSLIWTGFINTAGIAVTTTNVASELVGDGMVGSSRGDFLLKRVVGTIAVAPQAAATGSGNIGVGIMRTRHSNTGSLSSPIANLAPDDTDIDSHSQDWLWRKNFRPSYGARLDATALDLSQVIDVDLRGRPTLRRLEKIHGLQLFYKAETSGQIDIFIHLRILIEII